MPPPNMTTPLPAAQPPATATPPPVSPAAALPPVTTAPPPPMTETIILVVPIEMRGGTVSQLTMRRPKVNDRLAIDGRKDLSDAAKEVLMIGSLIGFAPEEVGKLDMADYGQIQEKLEDFTKARPAKS